MASRKLQTRFIEINRSDDYEQDICVMTSFIPKDVDLYRSQTMPSSPFFPNQLDKFSIITELKHFSIYDVELDKIVSLIEALSGDSMEIVNIGLDKPMVKVIQKKLDNAKINFIWHDLEHIDTIEFVKKIHLDCTKIRIDSVKMKAKNDIDMLRTEFF